MTSQEQRFATDAYLTLINDNKTHTKLVNYCCKYTVKELPSALEEWLLTNTQIKKFPSSFCLEEVSKRLAQYYRSLAKQNNIPHPEEKPMHPDTPQAVCGTSPSDIPYRKEEFIFGKNISAMSTDEMIRAVQQLEKEYQALEIIKTKAKAIESKKADISAALKRLTEALDK